MKIYLAGPISGDPDYVQHFAAAERKLLATGHAVVNPVKNPGFTYKEYIDMGLCELMRCDTIYLLPGWEKSPGACLEFHYAVTTDMRIFYDR